MSETAMTQFSTGATRTADEGKPDFRGFLSSFALRAYGAYMHQHRVQADGKLRASDNWKLGLEIPRYMSSLYRHHLEAQAIYEGINFADPKVPVSNAQLIEALCAVVFNAFGAIHEMEKAAYIDSATAAVENETEEEAPEENAEAETSLVDYVKALFAAK